LTWLNGQNIMKDALEFQGREITSDEENIPAEEKEETETARFYEKDVHFRRQKGFKPQKEKRTHQIECLRPLTGLNFLREV